VLSTAWMQLLLSSELFYITDVFVMRVKTRAA